MNTRPVQAILFDLDGTLLNSLEDLADAANAALEAAGYSPHPVEAYKHFVGNGIEMLMRRALPQRQAGTPSEADRLGGDFFSLVESMRVRYDRSWHDKSRPYPGIPDLLKTLGVRGLPMGVLSNKPHEWTLEIINYFFPDVPFAVVRGAKPGVPHKPNPEAALLLARELNVPPAEIFFVGDSNVDVATGLNAGMRTVGVTWGFRGEDELRKAGASVLIYQPDELIKYL